MEWLTLLNTCLTIVLTSVCGYTTWYLQKRFSDKSVTAEALKIILRKQLREAGLTYKVYKNTMMRFAFKDTDCEQLDDLLNGPSAIVVSKTDLKQRKSPV